MSPNDGTMYKVFETKWWHLPKYLEIQSYSMMVVFETMCWYLPKYSEIQSYSMMVLFDYLIFSTKLTFGKLYESVYKLSVYRKIFQSELTACSLLKF